MKTLPKQELPMAFVSLACAILAILTGFVSQGGVGFLIGIPAVLAGHVAWHRIRKSDGALVGLESAAGGLVLGYLSCALWMTDGTFLHHDRRAIASKLNIDALNVGLHGFELEYGKLPDVGTYDLTTDNTAGRRLLAALLGREESDGRRMNPRKIPFLTLREGKTRKKGGLVYLPTPVSGLDGLFDSWGNPYRVILLPSDDTSLAFSYGGRRVELSGKKFVIASRGPDGVEGTRDDLKTW